MQEDSLTFEEKYSIGELKRRILHDLPPSLLKDETLFYRFLKARDFNVKNAEDMLRKHLVQRKIYDMDNIITNYIPPELLHKYFPASIVGYSKEGYIVNYADCGRADVKGGLTLFTYEEIFRHVVHYLERAIQFMEEKSKEIGKPTQMVFILNFDQLSLSVVTNKKALQFAYEGFMLYQDNYPERIRSIYVINASFCFNIGYRFVKHILAEGLIKKTQIFGKTGWKEALLKCIDADVLPAFLGGNRTDPDGNPMCHTFIIHGSKIPEELYLKKDKKTLKTEQGVKKLIVSPFSCSEIEVYILEENSHIEWEFELQSKDIYFGLNFENNSDKEQLIPKQKIYTLFESQTGVIACNKSGKYMLIFDNSHSWIFSKEIYYRIKVIKQNSK